MQTEHLAWVNHAAAEACGKSLTEFADLDQAEQSKMIDYILRGPSRFRQILLVAEIRNMLSDWLCGAKKLTPLEEEWIDGTFGHPDEIEEMRVAMAIKERRERAKADALALMQRETGEG